MAVPLFGESGGKSARLFRVAKAFRTSAECRTVTGSVSSTARRLHDVVNRMITSTRRSCTRDGSSVALRLMRHMITTKTLYFFTGGAKLSRKKANEGVGISRGRGVPFR